MQPAQVSVHPPPSGRALHVAQSRLADLLHAAASIIEEIHRGEQTCKQRPFPPPALQLRAKDFEAPAQDDGASAGRQVNHGDDVTYAHERASAGSHVHCGNDVTSALDPHQLDVTTSSATCRGIEAFTATSVGCPRTPSAHLPHLMGP
ncbi:unnamed protein product [Lampetra planeri]